MRDHMRNGVAIHVMLITASRAPSSFEEVSRSQTNATPKDRSFRSMNSRDRPGLKGVHFENIRN